MRLVLALCVNISLAGLMAAQAPPITPQAAVPIVNGPAATAPPANFVPPGFELDPVQQAYLDQVLGAWETESGKVQNFQCPFTRWEYNAFGPNMETAFTIAEGQLSYQQPDKGSFQIISIQQWQGGSRAARISRAAARSACRAAERDWRALGLRRNFHLRVQDRAINACRTAIT